MSQTLSLKGRPVDLKQIRERHEQDERVRLGTARPAVNDPWNYVTTRSAHKQRGLLLGEVDRLQALYDGLSQDIEELRKQRACPVHGRCKQCHPEDAQYG